MEATDKTLEKLFRYCNDLIIIIDENLCVLEANEAVLKLIALDRADIVNKSLEQLKKNTGIQLQFGADLFKGKEEVLQNLHCDIVMGKNGVYEISWTAIRTFSDKSKQDCQQICLIGKPIEQTKYFSLHAFNDQKQLAKDDEIILLKNILMHLPGHIYWKDKKGIYLGSNEGNTKSAGLASPDDILGKTDYELPWKDRADQYRKADLYVINTGKAVIREEVGLLADGAQITVLSQKTPLRDRCGNIIGIVGNSIDITELKKTQQALLYAKERAQAANKLKTEFILNMQHDLRTPAAGVSGLTGILAHSEKDPERKRKLLLANKAANELLNILGDILRFGKIEDGYFPIFEKRINLARIINSVIDLESAVVTEKNLQLTVQYDPKIPKVLIGDDFRIQKILINLIGNAAKFTKEGGITVTTTLLKKRGKQVTVSIKIADTGIGIPEDKQDIIYEKFVRLDPSNRNQYKGTGLGLYLVKQFLHDIGGEISLESKVGEGSAFTCILPLKTSLAN